MRLLLFTPRILAALAMAYSAAWPVAADAKPRRTFCVSVYIEGVGTVRICPPARGR